MKHYNLQGLAINHFKKINKTYKNLFLVVGNKVQELANYPNF